MSAEDDIDAMIRRLRGMGSVAAELAPVAAKTIAAELQRSTTAGETPDGEAWAPRKQDGARAMRDANAAVYVAAVGGTVWVRLKGPETRHHKGTAKGRVKRQVIPTDRVPERMAAQLRVVFDKWFAEHMTGGA